MELYIVLLVLFSATLHPIWNLFVKKNPDPQLGFLLLTGTIAIIALIHGLVSGADFSLILTVLPLLAISVCGQIMYGTCLTAALKQGDLSAYYPIIRASPVVVVIISVLLFGKSYSWYVLLGIGMVLIGSILLLYRRGSRFFDDPVTLGFALLALFGTGVYSLADAQLMQTIPPPLLVLAVDSTVFPIYLMLWLRNRPQIKPGELSAYLLSPARVILPGIICYTSYYLILKAYQLGGDVAVVTALRQASIPISVALGGLFLREGAMARRFVAASILALGIVVISVYG